MSEVKNATFEEIGEILEGNERFLVASHVRPDGDAIGSTLAMGYALRSMGKEVIMVNQDGIPGVFRFLPGVDAIETPDAYPDGVEVDVVCALDTAVQNRVGSGVLGLVEGKDVKWVNIDHHVSNPGYGDVNYIDGESPATGQILYELIHALKVPLTEEVRNALWAGITTDTGSFQYPSTTAKTFEIGAELIREGVDVGKISEQIFDSYPRRRVELLRELLNVLKISDDGRVASWGLTIAARDKVGAHPEDTEDLINTIRGIEGVQVAVFFEELDDGHIRISSRSKTPEVDVSELCKKFNGGGHRLAAGARVSGTIEEVEAAFLGAVNECFEG
ncbi:MAG: bifunctional oligoribonuclease/PAP phosphatase NrnA [Verrucomicrobiota bacterium]